MAKNTNKKVLTPKQKAAKKRNRILLLILEVVILMVLLAVLYKVVTTLKSGNQGDGGRVDVDVSDIVVNEDIAEAIENGTGDLAMEGYRNIALLGIDSTNGSLGKGNRSDTMIIASINLETKEVKLVSLFRDTYLNVGNDTYTKANAAYAKNAAEATMGMMNMNLDLAITEYVTVGFEGLIDTIDALGGIEIEVDSAELEHINNYQYCIAEDLNRSYTEVTETGMQVLDGMQATAYCRIRYTAGNDFKRTERQREVIQAIVEKAKTAKLSTLTEIATDVFGKVQTDIELDEIVSLLGDINDYTIVDTTGFPFEEDRTTGTIGDKGSCVIPTTLAENVTALHEFLFGEVDYQPSDSVMEYSQKIYDDTVPYVTQDDPEATISE